ncbi:MAG: hypothetical protein EOO09_06710 [Chitinophagaceae bacterium]|nr:MAG: hypothetical protein EOO09_06710 [Chitinophagaceae bacterium]
MKKYSSNTNIFILFAVLAGSLLSLSSCEKDNDGPPVINEVRLLDPLKRDSFFTESLAGIFIVIQGNGFSGLQQLYINGLEATFNSALNTDNNIIVQIPLETPTEAVPDVPNNIRVVTTHGEASFAYRILVPPPAPLFTWASNENAVAGEVVTFRGTDLAGLTQLVFPGGTTSNTFTVNPAGTELVVSIPAGITGSDTIRMNGQFGSGKSMFVYDNYRAPKTGFLANFEDGDTFFGWQYWGGNKTNSAGFAANTGNYIQVKPSSSINAGDGGWYADNRAVMVAAGAWVPNDQLAEPIANYALKFEISVKTPWKNGSLIIAPNGNFNILARYAPWETAPGNEFKTTGWRTVTIPLNTFHVGTGNYDPAGPPPVNIAAMTGGGNSATMQIMLYNDSETPLPAFDAAVDNVRIVRIK